MKAPDLVQPRGAAASPTDAFADDVRVHLLRDPRQLPSAYFYDALGSALFEAICHLPWYPVTRAEARLIASQGSAVFQRCGELSTIVELGSGSGEKLRLLLESRSERAGRSPRRSLALHLVDVSGAALRQASRALGELGDAQVVTHECSYEAGLEEYAIDGPQVGRALMLFLGSNIGNFDRDGAGALLARMRAALRPGDALLLGADLVKPAAALRRAYDDPLGVTAAFNRNLLVRINRELGGNFDLAAYTHRAVWDAVASRVEMHLVSSRTQRVSIPRSGFEADIYAGEYIWTESSYKYEADGIIDLLEGAGFRRLDQWVDERDRFALTLVQAV